MKTALSGTCFLVPHRPWLCKWGSVSGIGYDIWLSTDEAVQGVIPIVEDLYGLVRMAGGRHG